MFALPVPLATGTLVLAAAAIMFAGPRMVHLADRLADVTGLGEAFVGAVLVGAATSLPDILATVLPAARGLPELAVGNALGGVLGQTAFLAVADLTYRRANLEHAAASLPNLVQATLLMTLLGGMMMLFAGPDVSVLGIHPGTVVLVGVYAYGLRLVAETGDAPMWTAVETEETRTDVPDEAEHDDGAPRAMWGRFVGLLALLGAAGTALAVAGESLVAVTGLSEALVATAVITMGLLRRERHGVGNIGIESAVVLALYITTVFLVL